jgi:hypothetical protein
VRGLVEEAPPITLVSNTVFWIDVRTNQLPLKGLARGGIYRHTPSCPACSDGTVYLDGSVWDAAEQAWFLSCQEMYDDDDGNMNTPQNPACDHWTGNRPDTVVVHLVGVLFDEFGEVDPQNVGRGYRALTAPGVSGYETSGMIIGSDNRERGLRANPDPATWYWWFVPWTVPGDGDISNLLAPEQRGWWGPSEYRDITPNLLSHELVHVFGQVHEEGDPYDDRVLVGLDFRECSQVSDPSCPGLAGQRGYRMYLPPRTEAEECSDVIASPFTR